MNALNCIKNLTNTALIISNLKYCLVDKNKRPYRFDGLLCKPNQVDDFVELEKLITGPNIEDYAGIGISIQASNICAIDVDHCFSTPNDIDSIDKRGKEILDLFEDVAYCEFSFSGTGMRILFKANIIEDYSTKWYIKNEKNSVEYYQPTNSYRYVTLTGNVIHNNILKEIENDLLIEFLNKYMLKPERISYEVFTHKTETRSFEQLMNLVKYHYFKNSKFQDIWFSKAPGSGKDESERDYFLISYLYENVTQDKNMIKQIFEQSPFFKSKDWKHVKKWENQEGRYFNYLYELMEKTH